MKSQSEIADENNKSTLEMKDQLIQTERKNGRET